MSAANKHQNVPSELQYVEIDDIQTISVMGETRWVAKAKFPKTTRGKSIVIFQFDSEMVAIPAFCPHEQANMSEGMFVAPFVLQCPLHQNEYDLRTGAIKAFKVEMLEDKMYLVVGAPIKWGASVEEVPNAEAPSPSADDNIVPLNVSAARNDLPSEKLVTSRSAEERILTLEKEIQLLMEAATAKDLQIKDGFAQMEVMVSEMESKKNDMQSAHKNLKSINEFVQRVTNSMSEILIVLDADGKIKEVNKRFATLLGYKPEEIVGRYLDFIFEPEDLAVFKKALEGKNQINKESLVYSALLLNHKWEAEVHLADKARNRFIHLLRSSIIISPNGKKEGVVIIGTDIRQLKEIQKSLNVAYEKVSALLNNIRQGIFVVLADGQIIDPVSAFAATIFEGEIVGKNVHEVLYRDIDPKSEVYASIRSGFITSFGEDAMQWMLSEDNFPRKVHLKFNSENGEARTKTLKVAYCPLWKEGAHEECLDRIMFVIEDITQLELLEKQMEEERLHNSKNIEILQELARNKPEDLKEFLENAYQSLEEVRRCLGQIERNRSAKEIMFRNLHTLKGNARVLGLKKIAHITHEVESNVEEMKHHERVQPEMLSKTEQGLGDIQKQINEYAELAQKVFNISNDFEVRQIQEVHKKILEVDLFVSTLGITGLLKPEFFEMYSDLYEDVRSLGDKDLNQSHRASMQAYDKMRRAPEDLESFDGFLSHYQQFISGFLSIYWCSRAFTPYVLAPNKWVKLYQELYQLSRTFLMANNNTSFTAQAGSIEDFVRKIVSLASAINHDGLVNLFTAAPAQSFKEWEYRGILEGRLQHAWRELAYISHIETVSLVPKETRSALVEELNNHFIGKNPSKQLSQKVLRSGVFTSFLQANLKTGIDIKQSLGTLSLMMGGAISEVFSGFIAPIESVYATFDAEKVYESEESTAKYFRAAWDFMQTSAAEKENSSDLMGSAYLRELSYYRTILSYYRLMEGHTDLMFEKIQTINVVEGNLQQLLMVVEKMKDHPEFSTLKRIINKLGESPLVPALQKYHAMVTEVANRLNKKVEFRVVNEETVTLPRATLTLLQDAMVHLLRNAVDHGVEPPEVRIQRGKTETALVQVECRELENGDVQVILSDDGGGIDGDKVLLKSIKMGIVDPLHASKMTEDEKLNLIFTPNLTTKENVTDLSGRGVGMDVVKQNIDQIGRLEIKSKLGRGTEFIISLSNSTK